MDPIWVFARLAAMRACAFNSQLQPPAMALPFNFPHPTMALPVSEQVPTFDKLRAYHFSGEKALPLDVLHGFAKRAWARMNPSEKEDAESLDATDRPKIERILRYYLSDYLRFRGGQTARPSFRDGTGISISKRKPRRSGKKPRKIIRSVYPNILRSLERVRKYHVYGDKALSADDLHGLAKRAWARMNPSEKEDAESLDAADARRIRIILYTYVSEYRTTAKGNWSPQSFRTEALEALGNGDQHKQPDQQPDQQLDQQPDHVGAGDSLWEHWIKPLFAQNFFYTELCRTLLPIQLAAAAAQRRTIDESFRAPLEKMVDDKAFIISCSRKNGLVLQFVSDRYEEDKEVVKAAVVENERAAEWASQTLLEEERGFIISCLQENGLLLQNTVIRRNYGDDEEAVFAAVGQNERAMEWVAPRFGSAQDLDLAKRLFVQNYRSLEYFQNDLKQDNEFLRQCFDEHRSGKQSKEVIQWAYGINQIVISFAPQELVRSWNLDL
jgi:hypothetical protein